MRLTFWDFLALVFITLKLTNFIDWSWKWVLAPFWIPFCISTFIILSVEITKEIKR